MTGLQDVCAFRGDHFFPFQGYCDQDTTTITSITHTLYPTGVTRWRPAKVSLASQTGAALVFQSSSGRLHAAIETGLPWPTLPTKPLPQKSQKSIYAEFHTPISAISPIFQALCFRSKRLWLELISFRYSRLWSIYSP